MGISGFSGTQVYYDNTFSTSNGATTNQPATYFSAGSLAN
jgi:hypothetical protein